MKRGNSNLVDITCEVVSRRDKAVAIVDGTIEKFKDHAGEERQRPKWFWLPKSEIEENGDGTITVPEWLAIEKGLV